MSHNPQVRRFPADLASLSQASDFARDSARAAGLPEERSEQVVLIVEEVFANIASYAYAEGQTGEVEIRCEAVERGVLRVEVADRGAAHNPLTQPEPNLSATLQQRPVGGLGIFLVRQLTQSLEYRRDDGYNRLQFVVKARPGG
jgi:anti-sigma regulatory factor (Ser/Thr protein kinase)